MLQKSTSRLTLTLPNHLGETTMTPHQTKEIVGLYDKQISFIGIARTLGITVKEVLAVLRANNRIWESR